MATPRDDGSYVLEDGEILYPNSLTTIQALLEVFQLKKRAPLWPFIGGGGGTEGVVGRDGSQGFQGIPGADGGPAGNVGNMGLTGFMGIQGPQGNQGVRGFQGVAGGSGGAGVQGAQGNQGIVGPSGNTGLTGFSGNQGNQGNQGTQGLQGAQGVQGTLALTGNQGNQGFQGGPSAWTDAGTTVHLTTTTDEVTVGPNTAIARLGVIGDTTSQVTAAFRQTAAQTAAVVDNQLSAGTVQSQIYPASFPGAYDVFNTAGDAQPTARVQSLGVFFGPGGGSGVDVSLRRKAASQLMVFGNGAGANPADLVPNTDNEGNIGTSPLRWADMSAVTFYVFNASGDAQPTARLENNVNAFTLGPGGGSGVDTMLRRKAASQFELRTNAGVAADLLPVADNQGNIGNASFRWSLVRAVTITPGDMHLDSGDGKAHWILREQPDSILAMNKINGKKYKLRLAKK